MSTIPGRVGFGKEKWLFWLLMNVLSIAVSSVIRFLGFFFAGLSGDEMGGLELILTGTWIGAVTGLAGGLFVGPAQWLVIRRHVPRAFHWIWRTAIGFSLGYAGSLTLMNTVSVVYPLGHLGAYWEFFITVVALSMGLILGTGIGAMQWTILRQTARGAWRWVVASGLAWAPGLYIALWSDQVYADGGYLGLLLYGGLGGLLVGAVTGVGLIWLLNHPE
jgi:hypothetical protein